MSDKPPTWVILLVGILVVSIEIGLPLGVIAAVLMNLWF